MPSITDRRQRWNYNVIGPDNSIKPSTLAKLDSLPNGSLVQYKGRVYFLSRGLEGRIVTGQDGHWHFVNKRGHMSPFAHARPESITVLYRHPD